MMIVRLFLSLSLTFPVLRPYLQNTTYCVWFFNIFLGENAPLSFFRASPLKRPCIPSIFSARKYPKQTQWTRNEITLTKQLIIA